MTKIVPKTVILASGNKGGSGKSFETVNLADFLRSRGLKVALFDADGSVGATVRVHGQRDKAGIVLPEQDPTVGCAFFNIRLASQRLMVASCIGIAADADVILMDLAGGSIGDAAAAMLAENDGDDTASGITKLLNSWGRRGFKQVIVIQPIIPNFAAVTSVGEHLDLFGDRAKHVVVLNERDGKASRYWMGFTDAKGTKKGGGTRKRFLEAGGLEIRLPALPASTAEVIEAENLSPMMAQEDPQFTIGEQDHCFNFVQEFAASHAPLLKILGVV